MIIKLYDNWQNKMEEQFKNEKLSCNRQVKKILSLISRGKVLLEGNDSGGNYTTYEIINF